MTRLTHDQIMDREIAKLAAMGVTMSVRLSPAVPGGEDRPFGVIRDAARRGGILEEEPGEST